MPKKPLKVVGTEDDEVAPQDENSKPKGGTVLFGSAGATVTISQEVAGQLRGSPEEVADGLDSIAEAVRNAASRLPKGVGSVTVALHVTPHSWRVDVTGVIS